MSRVGKRTAVMANEALFKDAILVSEVLDIEVNECELSPLIYYRSLFDNLDLKYVEG